MHQPTSEPSEGGRTPSTTRDRRSGDRAPGRSRTAERAGLPGAFTLRCARRGAAHVITLSGELDLATAPAVRDELVAAEATDADRIVLDLSALTFIDSTGLRTIVQGCARSKADGDRLRLLRGPTQVQRIFEITATTDMLPFID